MFYQTELQYLMRVLQKMHLQALLLTPSDARDYRIDLGFRAFLGLDEDYERAFRHYGLWSKSHTIYRLQDELFCSYIFLILPAGALTQALLIGPYITFEVRKEAVLEAAERFRVPAKRISQMEEYYKSIPLVQNESPLFSLVTAFGEVIWGSSAAFEIVDLNTELTESVKVLPEEEQMPGAEDVMLQMQLMETRYRYENELMDLVASGQTHRSEAMMASYAAKNFDQRLTDSLRNTKNYLIICNTLMRKAAERGGVHPFYLNSVSSEFARKIELISSAEKGQQLMEEIINSYGRLVRKHAMKHYSPIVQKAVTCIELGLENDLSLQALADVLNINPSYLSTLFRRETGQTVTAYVNEKRMQAGARLLQTTRLQIQTVAQHCGISDVNYFSKLFKKQYGISPKQFREQQAHPQVSRQSAT